MWGASGFTGKLTAEYLLARYGVAGKLRWAIAGRSAAKLETVRDDIARETGVTASALPILIGDADASAFLDTLTRRTQVVCTTVGPYARCTRATAWAALASSTGWAASAAARAVERWPACS